MTKEGGFPIKALGNDRTIRGQYPLITCKKNRRENSDKLIYLSEKIVGIDTQYNLLLNLQSKKKATILQGTVTVFTTYRKT